MAHDRAVELIEAIRENQESTIRTLLPLVDDINVQSPAHAHSTALMEAADRPAWILDALLAKGADLELRNDYGRTALRCAVDRLSFHDVQRLVAAGAHVDAVADDGYTPLFVAALLRQTDVIHELLAHGADIDACDRQGTTPLHLDSLVGFPETVRQLVDAGANVDVCDVYGRTPLMFAAGSDCGDYIAEILLEAGADALKVSVDGEDAATLAAAHGWRIATTMILAFGVNADARAGDEELTLLMLVGMQCWSELVASLLYHHHVNVHAKNSLGETALTYLQRLQHEQWDPLRENSVQQVAAVVVREHVHLLARGLRPGNPASSLSRISTHSIFDRNVLRIIREFL